MEIFKFIHTADLHLDSALSSINNTAKARMRRGELTNTFVRMVNYAVLNDVCGIIVAGDMFDVKNTSPAVKKQVLDIMRSAKNVTFYLLGGNHDGKAFDDDFTSNFPPNAVMLKDGQAYVKNNVCVVGFEGEDLNPECLPPFDENRFNVVVMHGQVTNGNEGINPKRFAGKNVDYLALGHVHSFSQGKIDRRGKWAYSGCPEGRGFDEIGEKGFVVFDTAGNLQFVPYCCRICREVEVDVTGTQSYITQLDKIKAKIANTSVNDAYKIMLVGELEPGVQIDTFAIANRLDELFYAKVVDKTKTKFDERKYLNEKSLKGEFFRVVQSLDMPDEQKQEILKYGFAAMEGAEVDND